MSDFVAVFDEFDAWEFYQLCTKHVEDRAYCKEVAKLLLEVQAGQLYTYGGRTRLHVILPEYKRIAVAVDRERRSVMVFLHIATRARREETLGETPEGGLQHLKTRRRGNIRVLVLFYERCGDGCFQLKTVEWVTPETRAMMNPHLSAFFREGSA
jgi:hypothetical protein